MCGIAGILTRPGTAPSEAALEAMAALLRHRGPDDHATHIDPRAGLGLTHNRLSIIDLSAAGRQPMHSASGRVLAFNGEVYNFRALGRELRERGHVFTSRTDSEVVLRAFDEWGASCLGRLHGMFALALWSPQDETLWLARDPLGMKPLYYTALRDGSVAFASEVKAFRALPGFRARPARESIEQYLELGYVYDLDATSLEGVSKVRPGHALALRHGRPPTTVRFFDAPRPDAHDARTLDERVSELHATLRQVVAEHLVADVPVGLLLSGGLDSSLVAALAARETRVTTLTMGFADSAVDERARARRVAEFVGSRHIELLLTPEEIYGGLEEAVDCVDDLFGDWGVVTTRLLYQRAREQGVKVVLVGEGSDELFGGYEPFAFRDGPLALPRLYRKYRGQRWGDGFPRFRRAFRAGLDEAGGDLFHAVRLFEVRHQLPNNYVMKVDKASMSVSVEARAPYLDPRVARLALATPARFLLAAGENKHLLRQVARRDGLLPEDVAGREKFGGSIAAAWMEDSPEFRCYARAAILERGGWVDALGLRDAMQRFFDRGQSGYRFPRKLSIFSHVAWRLLLLSLWSRRALDAAGPEAAT